MHCCVRRHLRLLCISHELLPPPNKNSLFEWSAYGEYSTHLRLPIISIPKKLSLSVTFNHMILGFPSWRSYTRKRVATLWFDWICFIEMNLRCEISMQIYPGAFNMTTGLPVGWFYYSLAKKTIYHQFIRVLARNAVSLCSALNRCDCMTTFYFWLSFNIFLYHRFWFALLISHDRFDAKITP